MMWLPAELHCHTRHSDGVMTPVQAAEVALRRGLRAIAITDHNTAEGGLTLAQHSIAQSIVVIPGEEVSTDWGHVLAYFLRETIGPGKFEDVIGEIRAQKGLAFMAHPFHIPLGNRWRRKPISRLDEQSFGLLDGIEVENGHNRAEGNRLAKELAERKEIAAISGSDAHFSFEVGNAICRIGCELADGDSIYQALKVGRMKPERRRFSGLGIYYAVGLLNRIRKQKYSFKGA